MSVPDRAKNSKRKYTPPKLGDMYTTHSSGVSGKIEEIVENKTGTSKLRLKTSDGKERWTTHVPPGSTVGKTPNPSDVQSALNDGHITKDEAAGLDKKNFGDK
jgi:hypothetical protein